MSEPLVQIRGLSKHFDVRDAEGRLRRLTAVDDVTIEIEKGETFGLVGESGCGKTTLARCLLRLDTPSDGTITFDGMPLDRMSRRELRPLRRRMQMVFQDPVASLNPRLTVRKMLGEPLRVHDVVGAELVEQKTIELLTQVGLNDDALDRYPHEFSGGQRQRLGIARALSVQPQLIVADEPVSSLDVSVRAQVLNLLLDLQERLALTYLFIAHDLHVVRHVSDHVGVMYLGRVVESGPAEAVYAHPAHPYTQALLAAAPSLDTKQVQEAPPLGEVPSPLDPPAGCHFHPRCPFAEEQCRKERPELRAVAEGHRAACHLAGELELT